MTNKASSCSVSTRQTTCACGGKFQRVPHPRHHITYFKCPDCGSEPNHYYIYKRVDGHYQEFYHDSKGRKIKTVDDCLRVATEVHYDFLAGTFDKRKYKKRSAVTYISDTIADFVEDKIFPNRKRLPMTEEDKVWMEDFMVPFMGEVGVFVVSHVHLRDFVRTFRLKGQDKERAERLFNMVIGQIRI